MANLKPTPPLEAVKTAIEPLVKSLGAAYAMELTAMQDYIALWTGMTGAKVANDSKLGRSVLCAATDNLDIAVKLAREIKKLGSTVPTAPIRRPRSRSPVLARPDGDDIGGIIRFVLATEEAAVERYRRIIDRSLSGGPGFAGIAMRLLGEHDHRKEKFLSCQKELGFAVSDVALLSSSSAEEDDAEYDDDEEDTFAMD